MRVSTSTPRRSTHTFVAAAAAAVALALACTGALAKPEGRQQPDRIGRFLADVALTPPAPIAALATATPLTPPPAIVPAATDSANKPNIAERVRDGASGMVLTAMNFLGVPYRFGGNSEDEGFDCSGFTRHVFALALGLVLPRRSQEQANAAGLVDIGADELAPGDLVFFNTLRRTFSHVGIYIGGGKFIHAPRTGSEVRIEDMRSSYWARRFDGARRASAAISRRLSAAY